MDKIRKNWLISYIALLVSMFIPTIGCLVFSVPVVPLIILILLISATINVMATKHCTWDSRGTKWVTSMMIINIVSVPLSIYQVILKFYNGIGLLPQEYGYFLIPVNVVFIWQSYLLRKAYLKERRDAAAELNENI